MHARRHTYLQSFIITDICLCPLSISLLVHLSLLSIYLSACLSIYPSIYLWVHLHGECCCSSEHLLNRHGWLPEPAASAAQ